MFFLGLPSREADALGVRTGSGRGVTKPIMGKLTSASA